MSASRTQPKIDGPSLFGLLTLAIVLGLPAAGAIYTLFWGQP